MNFQELEQRIGKQVESDWRQAKGGGWIHKDATVENEANIKDNAIIFGIAQVSGDAWVYGDAMVYGNAIVSGNAWVSGDAMIRGNAVVSGDAAVSGDAWEKSPLYVSDSRNHSATNCKHGWLRIGCEEHTFADWDKKFDAIAVRHNLTDEEKIEYRAIVDLFLKIGK